MAPGLPPLGISTSSGPQPWFGSDSLRGQETHPGPAFHGYLISDFMAKGMEVVLVQGYLCQEGKTDGSLSEFSFYERP